MDYKKGSCEGRPYCEVKLQRYIARPSEGSGVEGGRESGGLGSRGMRAGVAGTGISPGPGFWHPSCVHEVGSPRTRRIVGTQQAFGPRLWNKEQCSELSLWV